MWCDVQGNLQVPGRPTNLDFIVGQGHTALAVGAGGGFLDIFSLVYYFSLFSPSLWETARYRPPVLRIDNQQNFKIMKILILLKSFISLF